MKGIHRQGMGGVLLKAPIQIAFIVLFCLTMCVSCATIPPGSATTIDSFITTVAPIVIDVIAAKEQGRAARDTARANLQSQCNDDLTRASITAFRLLNEYRLVEPPGAVSTPEMKRMAWQIAYMKTEAWYTTQHKETPDQLVLRLYACANVKPPESMGWEFYATIALRHLGYNIDESGIGLVDVSL